MREISSIFFVALCYYFHTNFLSCPKVRSCEYNVAVWYSFSRYGILYVFMDIT